MVNFWPDGLCQLTETVLFKSFGFVQAAWFQAYLLPLEYGLTSDVNSHAILAHALKQLTCGFAVILKE